MPILRAFINNPSFSVPSQPEFVKAAPIDFEDPLLELVPEAYLDSQEPTAEQIQQAAEYLVRETAALAIRFPDLWNHDD